MKKSITINKIVRKLEFILDQMNIFEIIFLLEFFRIKNNGSLL